MIILRNKSFSKKEKENDDKDLMIGGTAAVGGTIVLGNTKKIDLLEKLLDIMMLLPKL